MPNSAPVREPHPAAKEIPKSKTICLLVVKLCIRITTSPLNSAENIEPLNFKGQTMQLPQSGGS